MWKSLYATPERHARYSAAIISQPHIFPVGWHDCCLGALPGSPAAGPLGARAHAGAGARLLAGVHAAAQKPRAPERAAGIPLPAPAVVPPAGRAVFAPAAAGGAALSSLAPPPTARTHPARSREKAAQHPPTLLLLPAARAPAGRPSIDATTGLLLEDVQPPKSCVVTQEHHTWHSASPIVNASRHIGHSGASLPCSRACRCRPATQRAQMHT